MAGYYRLLTGDPPCLSPKSGNRRMLMHMP
jgi:hypothetical protein